MSSSNVRNHSRIRSRSVGSSIHSRSVGRVTKVCLNMVIVLCVCGEGLPASPSEKAIKKGKSKHTVVHRIPYIKIIERTTIIIVFRSCS